MKVFIHTSTITVETLIRTLFLVILVLAPVFSGCGDTVSGNGDLGRMNYSLYSTYEMTPESIRDVHIVTGYAQHIDADLTEKGTEDAGGDDELISHRVEAGGVTVESSSDGAVLTVSEPGSYELQSVLDGEIFDKITLQFDDPKAIQLLVDVRAPDETDFEGVPSGEPTVVEEGAQAVFLPIPLDADGQRLAGDYDIAIGFAPESMAVFGVDVIGVYEDGIWTSSERDSIYFIEPGTVTVTLTDKVHAVSVSHVFEVVEQGAASAS